jgi:fumarylacetoacetase
VTFDALEPFRVHAFPRGDDEPSALQYINSQNDTKYGAFDITVEAWLVTGRMRERALPPFRVSSGTFADMYWTLGQLVAHHASNGCNLRSGDLLASGTISGPTEESRGCLLERTWRGTQPLLLPSGETRTFLEDGDTVILRAHCDRNGFVRIGLGECTGTVAPARV